MPVHQRGTGTLSNQYDVALVMAWYFDRQKRMLGESEDGVILNAEQERARKDKAMADRYERENAVQEGKLASIEEVEKFVFENNHRAKVRLLRLPRALAVAVPREVAITVETESEEQIREALEELADPDAFFEE